MRIAVLSDTVLPTPYDGGHGLGRMASQVAEGLFARGHDVTLFAKVGSRFSGRLITPLNASGYEGEWLLAREAYRLHKHDPFDVFLDNGHLHCLSQIFPDLNTLNVFHDNYQKYARCAVVVSQSQKSLLPDAFETAWVIPNTLPADSFEYRANPDLRNYAMFMGALADIKQPVLAVEACARMGIPLLMAGGQVNEGLTFGKHDNVTYVGVLSGASRQVLMAGARVFLQLGTAESFGLTTLEAGLCGVPVVGWPAGGTLDLIQYGVNGVFVPMTGKDNVQAVCDAIERAWYMKRVGCREYTETLCNVEAQITMYEDALAAAFRGEWW